MSWDERFIFGTAIEDFIRDYFLEVFSWSFVAGTINGEVVNWEFIEKIFDCKFIAPIPGRGPKLVFKDGKVASMPDLLLKSKNDLLFWVESKSSKKWKRNSIDIEIEKLLEYASIKKHTKHPVWIVVSVVENDFCEIYAAKIQDLLKSGETLENLFWGKMVRRYDLDNGVFQRLTDKPIRYK